MALAFDKLKNIFNNTSPHVHMAQDLNTNTVSIPNHTHTMTGLGTIRPMDDIEKMEDDIEEMEQVNSVEDKPHVKLAKEGRMVEAGACAEGLPRVVGLELTVEYNTTNDTTYLKVEWRLEDGRKLTQYSAPVQDKQVFQKLEVDFTENGTDGELLAYVRGLEDLNDADNTQ